MTRRKGHNVKPMDDLIIVENEEVTDWLKVRKKPKDPKPTPQQEKFKEYGRLVKEECAPFKGDARGMKSCQAKIRERVFGKGKRKSK